MSHFTVRVRRPVTRASEDKILVERILEEQAVRGGHKRYKLKIVGKNEEVWVMHDNFESGLEPLLRLWEVERDWLQTESQSSSSTKKRRSSSVHSNGSRKKRTNVKSSDVSSSDQEDTSMDTTEDGNANLSKIVEEAASDQLPEEPLTQPQPMYSSPPPEPASITLPKSTPIRPIALSNKFSPGSIRFLSVHSLTPRPQKSFVTESFNQLLTQDKPGVTQVLSSPRRTQPQLSQGDPAPSRSQIQTQTSQTYLSPPRHPPELAQDPKIPLVENNLKGNNEENESKTEEETRRSLTLVGGNSEEKAAISAACVLGLAFIAMCAMISGHLSLPNH